MTDQWKENSCSVGGDSPKWPFWGPKMLQVVQVKWTAKYKNMHFNVAARCSSISLCLYVKDQIVNLLEWMTKSKIFNNMPFSVVSSTVSISFYVSHWKALYFNTYTKCKIFAFILGCVTTIPSSMWQYVEHNSVSIKTFVAQCSLFNYASSSTLHTTEMVHGS